MLLGTPKDTDGSSALREVLLRSRGFFHTYNEDLSQIFFQFVLSGTCLSSSTRVQPVPHGSITRES